MLLSDIAKELNVSKATVSRAINGTGRLSPATRKRILDYVEKTGYVLNASASNLATARTWNIAYSLPFGEVSQVASYFLECMFGVGQAAFEKGYHMLVVEHKPDEMLHLLNSRKVDGLVLSYYNDDQASLKRLIDTGVPIVLTGRNDLPGLLQVDYDSSNAFEELTGRMIDRWACPMCLILTGHEFPVNEVRAEGFRRAFQKRGLPEPPVSWENARKEKIVDTMLSMYGQGCRGFLCGDDSICSDLISVLETYLRSGSPAEREMAQQVRLASFHSNRLLRLFYPDIPTVDLDPASLGVCAGHTLIRQIETKDAPGLTLLPFTLHDPYNS